MASKIVLITGANSGVGYAAAKAIAKSSEDFHVIMTGRSLSKVEAALSELKASGVLGSLSALQLDVTDELSIKQAAKSVEEEYGRLNALINNAGVGGRKEPDLKTRLLQCFTVNALGSALVAEAFRPLLLKSNDPRSIYVSSGGGSFGRNLQPSRQKLQFDEAYRVSKAAQNMLAVREYKDYGSEGLKVFAMSPGCVVSNLRGTSDDERSAWGLAGDPDVAGDTLLRIVLGERDDELDTFLVEKGCYPW